MNDFIFDSHKKTDYLSLALSIALHGIVACLLCYLPMNPSPTKTATARPYSVTLDLQSFTKSLQQSPYKSIPTARPKMTTPQPSITPAEAPTPAKADKLTPINPQPDEQPSNTPLLDNHEDLPDTLLEAPHIDTRGLYTGNDDDSGDNHKQTNASLELPGWIWDTAPAPIDDTSEVGKLVFKITIDNAGEVIGIETLETTVSPIVAQRYKNAIATLTFSKTSTEWQYTSTSVGKITFILQYA